MISVMKKTKTKYAGFSILEVLIAITIISFCIIPLVSMYRLSSKSNVMSVNAIHAANLASQRIEHFKFGGTIPPSPGMEDVPIGEYKRLLLLMEEVAAPIGATFSPLDPKWKPYERLEDFGKISNFPKFKRHTRITFFPEETPDPTQYDENILAPEYVRMTQRFKITVKMTWVEDLRDIGNPLKEKEFNMATIVSNKE